MIGETASTGDVPEHGRTLCRTAEAVARGECQKAGVAEPGGQGGVAVREGNVWAGWGCGRELTKEWLSFRETVPVSFVTTIDGFDYKELMYFQQVASTFAKLPLFESSQLYCQRAQSDIFLPCRRAALSPHWEHPRPPLPLTPPPGVGNFFRRGWGADTPQPLKS